MCVSCGCGQPNEDHGDARHITMEELEEAAQASNISTQEAARNISQGVGAETTSENPHRRS
jgi:hypothetical protein